MEGILLIWQYPFQVSLGLWSSLIGTMLTWSTHKKTNILRLCIAFQSHKRWRAEREMQCQTRPQCTDHRRTERSWERGRAGKFLQWDSKKTYQWYWFPRFLNGMTECKKTFIQMWENLFEPNLSVPWISYNLNWESYNVCWGEIRIQGFGKIWRKVLMHLPCPRLLGG